MCGFIYILVCMGLCISWFVWVDLYLGLYGLIYILVCMGLFIFWSAWVDLYLGLHGLIDIWFVWVDL